jgi:hypothetical protein
MAENLITLERLLDSENKVEADLEPQEIRKYEAAIRSASAAVRAYTDRDFTLNASGVATTRTFEYDDSGYIDIDDATSITGVQITFPYGGLPQTLITSQYQALPYEGPVYDNLIIYSPLSYGMSREMGFTWNLDTYDGPYGGPPPMVEVTGVWGWPAIPEDVQQAVVWIASAFSDPDRSVTAESIEGYSRSLSTVPLSSIPLRARELLDQYRRIIV